VNASTESGAAKFAFLTRSAKSVWFKWAANYII
jgi:hypothetical protein